MIIKEVIYNEYTFGGIRVKVPALNAWQTPLVMGNFKKVVKKIEQFDLESKEIAKADYKRYIKENVDLYKKIKIKRDELLELDKENVSNTGNVVFLQKKLSDLYSKLENNEFLINQIAQIFALNYGETIDMEEPKVEENS